MSERRGEGGNELLLHLPPGSGGGGIASVGGVVGVEMRGWMVVGIRSLGGYHHGIAYDNPDVGVVGDDDAHHVRALIDYVSDHQK